MVFVNADKFACESCIKGHRSSSCHHIDRPLFEIKRKGRPVSQCQRCRELRQSRRVHSKCTCQHNKDMAAQQVRALSSAKPMRYIPIVPALPNGLRDLQATRVSKIVPADSRQRVDTLLNPCNCKSIWRCKCRAYAPTPDQPEAESSLAALSRSASICSGLISSSQPLARPSHTLRLKRYSRPGTPTRCSGKRHRYNCTDILFPSPGPALPPILLSTSAETTLPIFPVMPPMTTISSLAGSGCTCGLQCACPGCIQHRGPAHTYKGRRDCADGCGSCIDHTVGTELPSAFNNITNPPSIIDQFFARAASLPRPPANRKMGVGFRIDPMNVMVYPTAALETERHGKAFGLVNLPKLECCGGVCVCPDGMCDCGNACDGYCAEDLTKRQRTADDPSFAESENGLKIEAVDLPIPVAAGSCCAK